MTESVETRFESKRFYDFVQQRPSSYPQYESVTRYLSLRKSKSPIETVELDEDSFWLAYSNWMDFVVYALGAYAALNPDKTATVYTYNTPSANNSRGEGHRLQGWHNAVFFGVVGRAEALDTLKLALWVTAGVPSEVVRGNTVDPEKTGQIQCDFSPDFIDFRGHGPPSVHIEDGKVWRPYEQNVWYTDPDWQPSQ